MKTWRRSLGVIVHFGGLAVLAHSYGLLVR